MGKVINVNTIKPNWISVIVLHLLTLDSLNMIEFNSLHANEHHYCGRFVLFEYCGCFVWNSM